MWVSLIIVSFIFTACDKEDDPEPTPKTGLEILEVPGTLLANIDSTYTIRARVADAGVDPDQVNCIVRFPDGQNTETFHLYDDGGTLILTDADFADTISNDVVPNDSIYTRTFNGRLLADSTAGDYTFEFSVPGQSDPIYTKTATILAANIEECLISSGTPLGTLSACFEPLALEVHVDRSDADEVDSVWLAEINPEPTYHLNLPHFERTSSDTVWQTSFSPAFARCLPTGGPYELEYRVRTRFGMECLQTVTIQNFVNSPPAVSNSTLPDTILRPVAPGDTDSIGFTVNLHDCELMGWTSYLGVKYSIRRRDRVEWTDSSAYFFRDDGISPDVVSGDGVFSTGLSISNNTPDSLYYFRFFAIECTVPYDTSEFVLDSAQIAPSSGVIFSEPNSVPFEAGSIFNAVEK